MPNPRDPDLTEDFSPPGLDYIQTLVSLLVRRYGLGLEESWDASMDDVDSLVMFDEDRSNKYGHRDFWDAARTQELAEHIKRIKKQKGKGRRAK